MKIQSQADAAVAVRPGQKDDRTLPSRDQLGDKAKAGPTASPVLLGVAFGRIMASKLP